MILSLALHCIGRVKELKCKFYFKHSAYATVVTAREANFHLWVDFFCPKSCMSGAGMRIFFFRMSERLKDKLTPPLLLQPSKSTFIS